VSTTITSPIASDLLGLAAQIDAEKLAAERTAWVEYRAIIRAAAAGEKPADMDRLREIMATLQLTPAMIDEDIATVKTEATLTTAMNTASEKATELLPKTTAANQRVTDLEAELRVAMDEARQVGAMSWSVTKTASERADDLKRLRRSPRMFAALK
jgi:hypothetical protein